MATIQISDDAIVEELKPVIRAALKEVLADLQQSNDLKMLSRKEIMDIFHVGAAKGSQIMSLVPKVEDVGHYCVPEHWLRKWIDENIQWVEGNTGYFGDFEKSAFQEVI